ncbi:MAG: endolytic transglycosylase MltG [Hyphomonadaceae bacterium]|nr:endolytic transglycosylase MltG [Hyphomonadaceae bacterium]MBX3510709.1 endolytic transglycosylase MltG [Hyphomonadaceae bacterium]
MARRSAPPPRPRRSGGLLSILFSLAFMAAAAAVLGALWFVVDTSRPGPSTEPAAFMVERGASAAAIGQALEEQHLIRSALMFRLASRAYADGRGLQAGEYQIPAGAPLREIVRMMADGEALMHAITFPEGITIAAAMRIIEQSDVLTGDMPEAPPEGSILPDTYHIQRGMTRAALLQLMREAHDRAVAEIWANRAPNLPITTPEQLVNLASIVERETGVPEERPMVAAVFINRLRVPMRLETDPTIIYGVCLRHPDRCNDGRLVNAQGQRRTIRASEIALDTGYNTYRIDGLPPTPISNPGRAALEATANPAQSDALFFVADGTGGHIFARTLAEHNANVARWREIEAQRLAQQRAAP